MGGSGSVFGKRNPDPIWIRIRTADYITSQYKVSLRCLDDGPLAAGPQNRRGGRPEDLPHAQRHHRERRGPAGGGQAQPGREGLAAGGRRLRHAQDLRTEGRRRPVHGGAVLQPVPADAGQRAAGEGDVPVQAAQGAGPRHPTQVPAHGLYGHVRARR